MKNYIYCTTTAKGEQSFYLMEQGTKYFLFVQAYRKSNKEIFEQGISLFDLRKSYFSSIGLWVICTYYCCMFKCTAFKSVCLLWSPQGTWELTSHFDVHCSFQGTHRNYLEPNSLEPQDFETNA